MDVPINLQQTVAFFQFLRSLPTYYVIQTVVVTHLSYFLLNFTKYCKRNFKILDYVYEQIKRKNCHSPKVCSFTHSDYTHVYAYVFYTKILHLCLKAIILHSVRNFLINLMKFVSSLNFITVYLSMPLSRQHIFVTRTTGRIYKIYRNNTLDIRQENSICNLFSRGEVKKRCYLQNSKEHKCFNNITNETFIQFPKKSNIRFCIYFNFCLKSLQLFYN